MNHPVRLRHAVALALAIAAPLAAHAEPCPPTVTARCTSLDISGKRWIDGRETTVKCKASEGHVGYFDPSRSGEHFTVSFRLNAGQPACDPILTDLSARDIEVVGTTERRAAMSGKPKNDCVFSAYDQAGGSTVDSAHFVSADGSFKWTTVSDTDGRLLPSQVKGALVYRTENTEGPVSFIGTVSAKDCKGYFTE